MLYIASAVLVGGSGLFLLACALFENLASGWIKCVFAPVVSALSALSGQCAFPIAEPLALLLLAGAVYLLFRSRRGLCLLLAALFAVWSLLWGPAYFAASAPVEHSQADARSLNALCVELIAALDAAGEFAPVAGLPAEAVKVAQLAHTNAPVRAAPKYARYPEWMRALSLAGLYVPWTFEAVLNPSEPEAGQPFTAVHELMHLGGIADEGLANIRAYEACISAGGAFAYSARLWALKYAMEMLRSLDSDAYSACAQRIAGSVREDFIDIGGFSAAQDQTGSVSALARLFGLGEKTGNYAALATWLCARENAEQAAP